MKSLNLGYSRGWRHLLVHSCHQGQCQLCRPPFISWSNLIYCPNLTWFKGLSLAQGYWLCWQNSSLSLCEPFSAPFHWRSQLTCLALHHKTEAEKSSPAEILILLESWHLLMPAACPFVSLKWFILTPLKLWFNPSIINISSGSQSLFCLIS